MVKAMEVKENTFLLQCQICREDKEPIPFDPLEETSFKHLCCLCSCELHVSVCGNCMFPWLEEYEGRMPDAEDALKYHPQDDREIVCAFCILTEEQGLEISDHMSIEQKKRLISVEMALDKHGDPSICILPGALEILPVGTNPPSSS